MLPSLWTCSASIPRPRNLAGRKSEVALDRDPSLWRQVRLRHEATSIAGPSSHNSACNQDRHLEIQCGVDVTCMKECWTGFMSLGF